MAAIAGGGRTLTGTAGTAERIPGQAVTPRFFEVLGVRTILGRTFDPTELIRQPKVAGQRTREFGIRMALGARAGDVLQLVLGGALRMTAAGVTIGLAGAAALTRFLATLLFAVKPVDAVTFFSAAGLLALAALGAHSVRCGKSHAPS
jgi:hypothetical protein